MPTRFKMDPELYLRVREREGRLYPDDIVRDLPSVPTGHPFRAEWQARSDSASRLIRYLARLSRQLTILDLGCGNGWLSNLLSESGHKVVGLDQNRYELQQAARVFSTDSNISFVEGDIFSAPFKKGSFDIVLFASAIQYFDDVPVLFSTLHKYLNLQAEIHIIDSPLYEDGELEAAAQRSQQYYSQLGFPEMANLYFHHSLAVLEAFQPTILYQPSNPLSQLKRWLHRGDSPFPWIAIQKQSIK